MGYKFGSGLVIVIIVSFESGVGKFWKKYGNRNKKEKSRRFYKYLDMWIWVVVEMVFVLCI